MTDNNQPPESPKENPDQNSEANPLPKDDSSPGTFVRRFQDSTSLAKRHKFWETQPVGQFKEFGDTSLPEGPIEPPTPLSEVKQEPYNLPSPYEWTTCDMDSEETCTEVYNLLKNNYVEDDENLFRFNYSKEFLRWALRPPGYYKSWHIGVCAKASKKLVAFITGIPARIRVRDEIVKMAEINFLCVHKKLRSKRLAPVMIKEVTRRVHLENIWQAAYTAGVVLPTPITTCQYWHRSLNPKKLIEVGFSRLGARMTMSRTIKLYKLPDSPATPGFRKMELRDVSAVTRLLRNYLSQFVVAPDFDENDVEHWLLPTEDVVDSYLVESPETHDITDFCSFYTLPSSILGNQNYSILKAAYSLNLKGPFSQTLFHCFNNFLRSSDQSIIQSKPKSTMGTTGGSDVEAGFAKLQGEDFEYYMQTYSIMLGRNSKKSTVDVDLASLGGGMNISRHHARIFYDFTRRRFALEVLGKNGCLVEGVLHLPGNPPVKLDSQDLLQIGDKEFYFLLPVRSILGGGLAPRHHGSIYQTTGAAGGAAPHHAYHGGTETGRTVGSVAGSAVVAAGAKKVRGREYYEEYGEEEDVGSGGKKIRRDEWYSGVETGSGGKAGLAGALVPVDKKGEGRSRVDRESDNQQLMQLEEKDVVSSVATVLSDLCGPGEWMPMEKLHAELVEQFSNIWHHSRVRRYLTSEDCPGPESKGKPWYGLLMLLRKYPEHFVINTRSKFRTTQEFVSLVSLLS